MAFRNRKQGLQQCIAELFEFASRPDRHLTGVASRDLPEVGKLNLERDGASTSPGALAVSPDLVDDLPEPTLRRFVGEQTDRKRVLGTDGFSGSGRRERAARAAR
jgi:hypothetical protein